VRLRGAVRNNLRDVDVRFARHRFNVVSGVSGSGKSTLVRDLLVRHGASLLRGDLDDKTLAADPGTWGIAAIDGLGPEVVPGKRKDDGSPVTTPGVGRIIEVDQSPIGRTPRSCPATYLKVFSPIRSLFAEQRDAKVLGLDAGHFSYNVARGRCPSCAGAGTIKLEMSFLPTVYMPCDDCEGRRYTSQTLQVRYGGATIADVLEMSIAEAAGHFRSFRKIHEPLAMATKVGLGYLRLGQGSNTLSGGEAQRIKIVAELAKRRREETLYVLDEPSTGLHPLDLARLLAVLHELVERGDTLIVIEHDLDVLRSADWLVDLGPGPGEQGGAVVHEGTVEGLLRAKRKAKRDAPTAVALRA
jgi:excinuclease ABC subunit A